MDSSTLILTVNLLFSTLIFWAVAKIYILPNLHKWDPKKVVVPILLLQSTRHLGLMFLAVGVIRTGMPAEFAYPAALGDFAAAIMAIIAVLLLLRGAAAAWPLVWVVTVFGAIDFLAAIALATVFDASQYMGASWWIPALWVPALLVGHYVTFVVLWRRKTAAESE